MGLNTGMIFLSRTELLLTHMNDLIPPGLPGAIFWKLPAFHFSRGYVQKHGVWTCERPLIHPGVEVIMRFHAYTVTGNGRLSSP